MTPQLKAKILQKCSNVIYPGYNKSIVELGCIKDIQYENQKLLLRVELLAVNTSLEKSMKDLLKTFLLELSDIEEVSIKTYVKPKANPTQDASTEKLAKIKNIIAVSSCKGGVGKSTVSVNFSMALQKLGYKVGLFDADIYGPSIPTMINTDKKLVMNEDSSIEPIPAAGLKCMSFGYIEQSADEAAVLRGPMVSQITSQLLTSTNWGELDFLVMDLPPGTGDIQITLCQLVNLAAAIIVTTPQHISFIDVVKGIEMFDTLNVPVIGAVENMSYFQSSPETKKEYPFGKGALRRLKAEFGFKNTTSLPLNSDISAAGDVGIPLILSEPEHFINKYFLNFAQQSIAEIENLAQFELPKVDYDEKQGVIVYFADKKVVISSKKLRLACQSALTVDEFTGVLKINPDDVSDEIYPLSMNPVGNYALGINWSDGHSSLYPYEQLLSYQTF